MPKGVIAELEKGLNWHNEGHSGDGLNPDTVAWATRMANGAKISPDKVKKMRAWLARHETDKEGEGFYPNQEGFPSPGRVAWALWGGDPAVSWSNKIVNQMEKEDEKKGLELVKQNTQQTEEQKKDLRYKIWHNYIEKLHGPAEKNFEKVMEEYFRGAAKRYAERIRQQKASKSMGPKQIIKILDINALMAIYDEFVILMKYMKGTPDRIVNGRLIKGSPGAWQGIWDKAGKSSLRKILRMANIPAPSDLVWGQQEFADYQMERAVNQIINTTGEQITQRVEKGLLEGSSLDDIAKSIQDIATDAQKMQGDKTFGFSRAKMIARTESTNAITGAQLRSFEAAKTDFGLNIKKAWLANRDDHTRDLHLDLETKYGRNDQAIDTTEDFKIGRFAASGPGKFGVAEMDINCRCTVVPVIIK